MLNVLNSKCIFVCYMNVLKSLLDLIRNSTASNDLFVYISQHINFMLTKV